MKALVNASLIDLIGLCLGAAPQANRMPISQRDAGQDCAETTGTDNS